MEVDGVALRLRNDGLATAKDAGLFFAAVEIKAAAYLKKGLSESGCQVEVSHNGIDGLFVPSGMASPPPPST